MVIYVNIEKIEIKKEPVIVFMGTPSFAVSILEGLVENYKVKMVVTQPDKKVGRKGEYQKSPVKDFANKHNILTLQPSNINEILQEINVLEPDLIVTCAYGQKLPLELLLIPKLGCINVHASLLPKLRGGAPIHRAIIDGHSKTGITIMYMAESMDTGDIISQKEIDILEDDTYLTLHDKLKELGKELLLETLPDVLNKTNDRIKQDESSATYAFIIKRSDEKIDFGNTRRDVYNKVRGLNSHPGAYCLLDDKILKVWKCRKTTNVFPLLENGHVTAIYDDGFGVKVSNGEVVLTEVQPEGKKKMNAKDFANGFKDLKDKVLK